MVLEEANVTDLTVDALAKARMLASRHWAVDEVAETVAVADGQRLTQALMQLAANAVQELAVAREPGLACPS